MQVINNEMIVCVDVDKTLILPQKRETSKTIPFEYGGDTVHMKPHKLQIDLVKHQKHRGCYIIVWSANGYAWAETAVNKLGLKDYVDTIMSKPMKYIDDLDCSEWMGQRVYLKPDEDID